MHVHCYSAPPGDPLALRKSFSFDYFESITYFASFDKLLFSLFNDIEVLWDIQKVCSKNIFVLFYFLYTYI